MSNEDELLARYEALLARVAAWQTAWAQRGNADNAAVATLLSEAFLGETMAQQIEKRLLEARREIDNGIGRLAGSLAAGVAGLCRAGDTDSLERRTQERFLEIGRVEDGFATKMAELEPLVALYRRLRVAVSPTVVG